jgi:hypothetical protein
VGEKLESVWDKFGSLEAEDLRDRVADSVDGKLKVKQITVEIGDDRASVIYK